MFDFITKKCTNIFTLLYLLIISSHDLENEEVIKKIQNRKVYKLMKHAYTIPFYRKKFEEVNLTPKDFRCAEDLIKFPILTKQEIREWILPTVKSNPQKYKYWNEVTTSGSTGTPLSIYVSPTENAMLAANWMRIGMCNGLNPIKDKTMALKDPQIVKRRNGKDSFIQRFGILRRHCISFLSDGQQIYENLHEQKPEYIYIHRSKLLQTIMYAEKNKLKIHIPKLCGIIGEGIDENSKPLIDKYFSKVYFSSYGTMETGACTFTKKGDVKKHVVTRDTHVINIVNEKGEIAKKGKMIITNLFFKGFPIINYDVNDGAEQIKENGLTYITNIQGRLNDMLRFSDGSTVDYHAFYSVMEGRKDILQFRIIQEDYKNILIQLVGKTEYDNYKDSAELEIRTAISRIIKDDTVMYHFEWLDELEPDKNGKRRFIISKI